ncbi:MAG: flagellar protein FlgN [Oscillospiraceae bacterium]|nr:flagellar protein FlgN [Oscillospiraceae bacterium]
MDWKQLINVLTEIKAVYTELLALTEETRTAVFDKDIDRLDAVVRREQEAAVRLEHWEKRRLACMAVPEGSPDPPTLLFFAGQAPEEEGLRLRSLHDELDGLIQNLLLKNKENKKLVESKLDYVRFALDALQAEQTAGLYGSMYGSAPPDGGLIQKTVFDQKG